MRIALLLLLACSSAMGQSRWFAPFYIYTAPGSGPVTVRDTIKANNRDATSFGTTEELNSSTYSGYLMAGNYGGTICEAGYEFLLNISQGATIDSAFLEIYVGSTYAGATDTIWHSVYDVDNAAVFNAADGHALSSHAAVWNTTRAPQSGFAAFTDYRIDVKDLVQHVVSRGGWSSGNYIGFIATKGTTINSDEFVNIANFEGGNSARTPRLVVHAH